MENMGYRLVLKARTAGAAQAAGVPNAVNLPAQAGLVTSGRVSRTSFGSRPSSCGATFTPAVSRSMAWKRCVGAQHRLRSAAIVYQRFTRSR